MAKTIKIPEMITVGDLAEKLDIPVTQLIGELMKNGVMATVNERIDFDTAEIVLGEMEGDYELELEEAKPQDGPEREKRDLQDSATDRPPVVAVMGHVDHGKTSLLDAIRDADHASTESGGITQHISAYQIEYNKRRITFLDTPGHEAFAALREHGATLTDVAVIVVAADDGVKPQTKEAVRFAQKAGVKIVVAINKMDAPGANPAMVKQQLADVNLLTEEWGGDIVTVEVSAKQKENIDKLLDMILLVADVEELKADIEGLAEGLIIEAHMEKGKGAVATALVEHGYLSPGDFISTGASFAKVRTLDGTDGKPIEEAGPSSPVVMSGFKKLPKFGDVFKEFKTEKEARQAAEKFAADEKNSSNKLDMTSSDLIAMINKSNEQDEVKIIIKADVQGSLKSVKDSLKALEHKEINARVIGSGVGPISESDVMMASTSGAIIYGFNVDMPINIKQLAATKQVSVRVFKVIYELIDDVRQEMSESLSPEIIETSVGRLVVKGVFRTTQSQVICGGEVTKGKIKPGVLARVERDGEEVAQVEVSKVQRQQEEVKEVVEGDMCGLELKTEKKVTVQEGDRLEFFTIETKKRTI